MAILIQTEKEKNEKLLVVNSSFRTPSRGHSRNYRLIHPPWLIDSTKMCNFPPWGGTYAPQSDSLKMAFSPLGDQMLYFSFTDCGA